MSSPALSAASCPDCGPATVSHAAEWWSAVFDWMLSPVTRPFGALKRLLDPLIFACHLEYPLAIAFRALAAAGLGTITHELDEKDNLRDRAVWESAHKRGIAMWEFRLFRRPQASFFVARKDGKQIVFDGLPRPGRRTAASLDWMDDKGVLKKKLAAAGVPVARGGSCRTLAQALRVFREVGAPVIAKPRVGSRSRHTTVGIRDEAALAAAFAKAKQLSPWVIVEEEMEGPVYRATLVGGKVAGVIRRDFPGVTGDGRSTVRALLEKENASPARHGPIFHEIPVDAETDAELASQKLAWESVPEKDRFVRLSTKASRSSGGATADVTGRTHPDNMAAFELVARTLADPVIGIDFIIKDIAKSWRDQRPCGVIECNSLPFVDLHHYPLYGEPRDVAGMLWDMVFPPSTGGA